MVFHGNEYEQCHWLPEISHRVVRVREVNTQPLLEQVSGQVVLAIMRNLETKRFCGKCASVLIFKCVACKYVCGRFDLRRTGKVVKRGDQTMTTTRKWLYSILCIWSKTSPPSEILWHSVPPSTHVLVSITLTEALTEMKSRIQAIIEQFVMLQRASIS
ncbi:hypothetical protein Pelo_6032 [Pelomyxa schiedti]|nr:hypothetical protein Pelo_6032 [Pelomyxa schiedti]